MKQAVAYAPNTQQARVLSPFGTRFLGFSCLYCLGGGTGIELIPHPGRPSMFLCGQKKYVIQN